MSFMGQLQDELAEFKKEGIYKRLNYLDSPQAARVQMEGRGEIVILSSNNYLGLCNVPEVMDAGKDALDRWGAGTGSVRFICGDRKSTRLNSSHLGISYAVFCLKKKNTKRPLWQSYI